MGEKKQPAPPLLLLLLLATVIAMARLDTQSPGQGLAAAAAIASTTSMVSPHSCVHTEGGGSGADGDKLTDSWEPVQFHVVVLSVSLLQILSSLCCLSLVLPLSKIPVDYV